MISTLTNLSLGAASSRADAASGDSSVLVAYFTRTGNTRVIAGQIRRALGADVFEIAPRDPYPEDYEQTVAQAQRERDSGYEPPLRERVSNITRYETIFIGFPIWGMAVPPVVRSFLRDHDFSDKRLVPFITHGGYGVGDTLTTLRQSTPGARIGDELVMEADQERRTLERVTGWLGPARSR
jgi:flavodoxin